MDGTERQIIEASSTTFVHSLDVFEKFVYWTDGDKKMVEKANRFHGGNATELRETLQFPYDIRVWHPLKQPMPKSEFCAAHTNLLGSQVHNIAHVKILLI